MAGVMGIGLLGEGVTGKAVRKICHHLDIDIIPETEASIVITSPGIPPRDHPKIKGEIISEIEWTSRLMLQLGIPTQIIGVTGTNGKSTVTSMISQLANIPALGNIGRPFCELLLMDPFPEWAVVELSSFQLETTPYFCPQIAIYTNIKPDHLAWHETFDAYVSAKMALIQHANPHTPVIYDDTDPTLVNVLDSQPGRHIPISTWSEWPNINQLMSQNPDWIGTHNYINAAQAARALVEIKTDITTIKQHLNTLKPLPYRCQRINDFNGYTIINDSKSTNIESTLVALASIQNDCILIFGGVDKGLELNPLFDTLQSVKKVMVYGEIEQRFIDEARLNPNVPRCEPCGNLNTVLNRLLTQPHPADTLLFSPGCSSFDQFENFEARGDAFNRLVDSYRKHN